MSRPAALPPAGVVRFYRYDSGANSFRDEVIAGLASAPKFIPARYRCDDEAHEGVAASISGDDAEHVLLRAHAGEIAALLGPETELIGFHAGASTRTRVLLGTARPSLYIPVDLCEPRLRSSVEALTADFPELNICALVADCARPIALPDFIGVPVRRRVVYCPAAIVGEFAPEAARSFLELACELLQPGGILLVAVGTKREPRLADDDGQRRVADESDRRLLERINRELGGDLRIDRFQREARHDAARGCTEIRLKSVEAQTVHVGGQSFDFGAGEALTVNAFWRYGIDEFRTLAAAAGFHPLEAWSAPDAPLAMYALLAT